MIYSMTAFASHTIPSPWGALTWETRSVNHRYLEMSVRLPEVLRQHEARVREIVGQAVKRGKIEVSLKLQAEAGVGGDLVVNDLMLQKLAQASQQVTRIFGTHQLNTLDILQWPGVLATQELDQETLWQTMQNGLSHLLQQIVSLRNREGEGIAKFLLERIAEIEQQIEIVKKALPQLLTRQRQRFHDKFSELKVEVDNTRLEQEMLFILQRSDVAEELQRLESHLLEVKRTVSEGGVVGRRLDFLMQELNREANTLSSKSIDAGLTQCAVAIKVAIEQMREQVQNIE